jgi:hypothetical protein
MPLSSRLIFTFHGIFLPLGAFFADFNHTHIFNPLWTPHAKFHGGQTLTFSILLGIISIYLAWRKTTDRVITVLAVSGFAAVYWVAQAGAILYPGAAAFDHEFVTSSSYLLGVPMQSYIEVICLALTGIAAWLALKPAAKWTS